MKRGSVLDDVPTKIFDQTALSRLEIATARGLSRDAVAQLCQINLASGAWEQVWKRVGRCHVWAYRKVKNK